MACVWHEWATPPDLVAASVLQSAADALRDGTMDERTARELLAGYRQRSLAQGGTP